MYRMVIKYPNIHKVLQMDTKYISIFQSKALIFFQIGIFGLKTNHLATLVKGPEISEDIARILAALKHLKSL
jgi:hypothetical protein